VPHERFRKYMVLLALAVVSSLVSVWYKGTPLGVPLNLFFQTMALVIALIVIVSAIIIFWLLPKMRNCRAKRDSDIFQEPEVKL